MVLRVGKLLVKLHLDLPVQVHVSFFGLVEIFDLVNDSFAGTSDLGW
jgi:hypothetical protein